MRFPKLKKAPDQLHYVFRELIIEKSDFDYINSFEFNFDETTFLIAALSEIRG
jgi:hypothetical protein